VEVVEEAASTLAPGEAPSRIAGIAAGDLGTDMAAAAALDSTAAAAVADAIRISARAAAAARPSEMARYFSLNLGSAVWLVELESQTTSSTWDAAVATARAAQEAL
jgi:hypothetical protein